MFTIDGSGTLSTYVNGQLATPTTVISGTLTLDKLGRAQSTYDPAGARSAFQFYNRTLSAGDVQQAYAARDIALTDCDDTDGTKHPASVRYKDADNDGYSDGTLSVQCAQPGTGYYLASSLTATTGDCDDAHALLSPATMRYQDADSDGYGDGGTQQ